MSILEELNLRTDKLRSLRDNISKSLRNNFPTEKIPDVTTLQQIDSILSTLSFDKLTNQGTITPDTVLSGKIGYSHGNKVIGSVPSKGAETYMPGISDAIISSGQYLVGNQTIKGDPNLLPENIKNGISIFGVNGSLQGGDSGGGGNANISPFTSIEIKTWTPAVDTLYYHIDDTTNLSAIGMFCRSSEVGSNGIHSLFCITDKMYALEQWDLPVGAWSGMAGGVTHGLAGYNYPSAGDIGDDAGTTGFRTGAEYIVILLYRG